METEPYGRIAHVGQVQVLPPQPQQLGLSAAHDAGELEQRAPRLACRREHLRQLVGGVDAPLGSVGHAGTLAVLKQREGVLAVPAAAAAGELEHARGHLDDAADGPLGKAGCSQLANELRRLVHVDGVQTAVAPSRLQVVPDVARVAAPCCRSQLGHLLGQPTVGRLPEPQARVGLHALSLGLAAEQIVTRSPRLRDRVERSRPTLLAGAVPVANLVAPVVARVDVGVAVAGHALTARLSLGLSHGRSPLLWSGPVAVLATPGGAACLCRSRTY